MTHMDPEGEIAALSRTIEDYERRFLMLDDHLRLLERERQKLSAVLNHTDAGFLVFDASLRVVWTNTVFARQFSGGAHPGAVLAAPCHEVVCRRASACEVCPAARSLRSGAMAHHEIRLEMGGEARTIYTTSMPIHSPAGAIDETIVMLQDISDLQVLRRSQEALRTSEERFRSIFEKAAIGMTTVAPDGRFLQVNPSLQRLLGYAEAELLRLTMDDVTHPEDRERSRGIHRESGAGVRATFELEKRYLRKDGATVWGYTTATWLYDAAGRPTYSVALVQDIGERKRAEEALRQSEARKGAILETALDGIITIDHAGGITEFNPAAERMFGCSRAQILGRELGRIVALPSPREMAGAGSGAGPHDGEETTIGRRIETSAARLDGAAFPVEVAVTRIPDGDPPSYTCYVRDLTERRQAEEALRQSEEQLRQSQKMEAIGTLAGGVAHDFNNLLTGILGYAEILKRETQAGEKVLHAAAVIETAARRAATLTQQLLGFARKGKHQNVAVDLHATIKEVMSLLSRTINKSINLRYDLRASSAFVLGDPGQMHQVILNLAVNAADAMPQGGDLVFSTEMARPRRQHGPGPEGEPADHQLMVTVTDTGTGIPDDVRGRIFEPFFTTKEQGKGTGMGLAMVYGTVKNHGGTIRVESEPGRGTTFRIYLPPAPESAASEDAARRATMVAGTGRILVVDDEEVVRSVAAEFLNVLGYEVVTAADGREALEIFRNRGRDLDLVIVDMIMPRMGGRECFRALKQIDPRVRVVLSTGYGFNVAAQEMLDEGMLGFIQKPYQMEQMSSVVAGALRGRG